MSPFPILKRNELNSQQQLLWDEVTIGPRGSLVGGTAVDHLEGLYNAWLQYPEFGLMMLRLGDANRRRSDLPPKMREMAILTTSILLNSRLEYDVHSMFAKLEGLSDEVIKAIGEGVPPPFIDDEERTIFDANVELVRTGTLAKATRDTVVQCFGLAGLTQLIAVISLYTAVSYTINVAEIELPKGFAIDPVKLQAFLNAQREPVENPSP
jgi:4-carboxymuconolactone decarboxylase